MSRSLFALCLFLVASAAAAGTPVVADDSTDANAKPDKAAATTSASQDGDATVGSHPTATPAHGSSSHAVTPRWHSLLPGMIR